MSMSVTISTPCGPGWTPSARRCAHYKLASVWGAGHAPFYGHVGLMSERRILRERCLRLDADADFRAASAIPCRPDRNAARGPAALRHGQLRAVHPLRAHAGGDADADIGRDARHPVVPDRPAQPERLPTGRSRSRTQAARRSRATSSPSTRSRADFLAERLGRDRVSFIAQPISDGPATVSKLAGARDLDELMEKNCGASHPAFDTRAEPSGGAELHRLFPPGEVDRPALCLLAPWPRTCRACSSSCITCSIRVCSSAA